MVMERTDASFSSRHSSIRPDEATPSHQSQPARGRKPQALVVDDAPDITALLAFMLSRAGYEVTTALSATDALDRARTHLFDLVVSDIGMPVMDGYALATALRALPDYHRVPIIAVTGFDQFDDRERALSAGFNAHLKKPIDQVKLLDLISHL